MFPRAFHLPAAGWILAGAALAASACGNQAPALTDPTEIITAALSKVAAAKSVHVDLAVDGSITADLTASGGAGTSLPLTGTSAAADVDIENDKAHATFAIPAFLNFNGEIIQVGTTSYVKTSLGGPKFEAQESTDTLPVDPTDASSFVEDVREALTAEGVDPVKGEDVDCGEKSCYSVTVELTPDELAGLRGPEIPPDLPIDMDAATVNVSVRVEKDTLNLAGLTAVVSVGAQGTVTLTFTMSNWDATMDIKAPPPDQIEPAT